MVHCHANRLTNSSAFSATSRQASQGVYRLIKAKPLVAIVEDDPASQKTLARVLRRGGYEAVNPDVPKPEVRHFRQKASHELLNRDGPVSLNH